MLIVYVAHPIGGDVQRNMGLVENICGRIYQHRPEIVPLAPYLMALKFLNDNDPADRLRGVSMNKEFFTRRLIDEVWLFGDKISNGMWEEIGWARGLRIPVIPMSTKLLKELTLREVKEGNLIQVGCDGPGQNVLARFLGFLPNEEGIRIRNKHWGKAQILYHEIPWCDIARIAPYGFPLESPNRFK